ncbi:type II restriction endonuclease [Guptibacillus sedimenti]|uniref:type II restriction endonuclease n=1 Tax=Guptibacillus sedimenti TaxID=3025680 RepID=UPI00235EE974|nr:type II restriction endonuclease [Pseudalkalibacillus sedimenti]
MQLDKKAKLSDLIEAAELIGRFYCKFITANDVGLTNAHQEGLHVSKDAWGIFFEEAGIKGNNKDKIVKMHMDGYYSFESRVIYYGKGTRNEYRITRFWSNAPCDKNEQVGNLIVFLPMDDEEFSVFILDTESDIEGFRKQFSLSLVNNNAVYQNGRVSDVLLSQKLKKEVEQYASLYTGFPETIHLAGLAREVYENVYGNKSFDLDKFLLKWIETEYSLFRAIEKNVYKEYLIEPFYELDPLLKFASSALNRRKSRAGRSLEHHIDYIFNKVNLPFSHPGKTEGNKKPDFLLPSSVEYADLQYDSKDLIFLGAKTTCKDRWRQVLNEADRIPVKHLLTLQQGITVNQLNEMQSENVILVVPKMYHTAYPESHRHRLLTVGEFIQYAKEKYK